jgi:hypothetical protein
MKSRRGKTPFYERPCPDVGTFLPASRERALFTSVRLEALLKFITSRYCLLLTYYQSQCWLSKLSALLTEVPYKSSVGKIDIEIDGHLLGMR